MRFWRSAFSIPSIPSPLLPPCKLSQNIFERKTVTVSELENLLLPPLQEAKIVFPFSPSEYLGDGW